MGTIKETLVGVAVVSMVTVDVGGKTNILVILMLGRNKAKHLSPIQKRLFKTGRDAVWDDEWV